MQKNNSVSVNNKDKSLMRTNKQKKFLRRPKNKTAKKQYFKELVQSSRQGPELAGSLIRNDLETFAKILEFADISKELDLNVLELLFDLRQATLWISLFEQDVDRVEAFFNFAHHNVLALLFQILIALKEKVLTNYESSQMLLLSIIEFFNFSVGLKRIEKILRNTKGFEILSQPGFWEPVYFSPKFVGFVKLSTLWFPVRISRQKSFTEDFVEKYVALARECICEKKLICNVTGDAIHVQTIERVARTKIQTISGIILESEQGELFLKLVSDLPEKSDLIPSESYAKILQSDSVWGKARALVRCTNCGVLEKSEKEFQKCSRCRFVFYCSKACQRNDWQNHKQICKEIKKQI